MLTIKAIADKRIMPKKCIFLGLPVTWALEHDFPIDKWITNFSVPSLFIQNTHDPFFSYQELVAFLQEKNVSNHQLVCTIGKTHNYEEYGLLREHILTFLEM